MNYLWIQLRLTREKSKRDGDTSFRGSVNKEPAVVGIASLVDAKRKERKQESVVSTVTWARSTRTESEEEKYNA